MVKGDKYTKFSNDLLDKLITAQFTEREWRLLMLVYRMSIGCHKECLKLDHWKDLGIIAIEPGNYKKLLLHLEVCEVLKINWEEKTLKINEDHKEWRVSFCRGYTHEGYAKLLGVNLKSYIKHNFPDEESYILYNQKVIDNITPTGDKPNDGIENSPSKDIIKNHDHNNDIDHISTQEEKESDIRRWVLMEVGNWFGLMYQVSKKREIDHIQAIGKHEPSLIKKALETTKSTYDDGDIDSPSAALGYIKGCLKNMARRQAIGEKMRQENDLGKEQNFASTEELEAHGIKTVPVSPTIPMPTDDEDDIGF